MHKRLTTFEAFLADSARIGRHVTLVPVAFGGKDVRFYAQPEDEDQTAVDFAVRGNTLVHLPFDAETAAALPMDMEPGVTILDASKSGEGEVFDRLSDLMNCVDVLTPQPFERIVTEPKQWAVNWMDSEGLAHTDAFASAAEAVAFCDAHRGPAHASSIAS